MAALATDLKLSVIDAEKPHPFAVPIKKINEGQDVPAFLTSRAYHDILTFLIQLNTAMFPHCMLEPNGGSTKVSIWDIDSPLVSFSATVTRLRHLLDKLGRIIDEVPPDPGPRRFGNASFKRWSEILASQAPALLQLYLPPNILARQSATEITARSELESYLLGGFGSPERLDYGTGHELSFLAFLGCIWKLGGFESTASGEEERGVVLGVIEPYLRLVRRLIRSYTLEPAGSHGVWGLDDHSFIPYIFGSAQYAPALSNTSELPPEGSRHDAPNPADVAKASTVERERNKNLYFGAVGFIYDVKKGPFWEHSPMLFDISGVPKGWAKINKGMIKMYNAEVLSKFPVVQHFRFGSLFSWEQQPNSIKPPASVHTSNQPLREIISSSTISEESNVAHSRDASHTSAPNSKESGLGSVHESSKISIPGLPVQVEKSTPPSYSQEVSKAPWATQLPAIPVPSLDTTAPWVNQPAKEADTASAQTSQIGLEQSAHPAEAEDSGVALQASEAEYLGIGSMPPPARVS